MGRVIAAAAYSAGRRVADIAVAESGAWAAKPGHFVWIGIEARSEPDLRQLQAQFGLHELAIEDALKAHQRPKVETYGGTTTFRLEPGIVVSSRARAPSDGRRKPDQADRTPPAAPLSREAAAKPTCQGPHQLVAQARAGNQSRHADPVVGDHEPELIAIALEAHGHRARAIIGEGVLQRIGHQLVDNQPQQPGACRGEGVALGLDLEPHRPQPHHRGVQVVAQAFQEHPAVHDRAAVVPTEAGMELPQDMNPLGGGRERRPDGWVSGGVALQLDNGGEHR
jgi:hypothetical protein